MILRSALFSMVLAIASLGGLVGCGTSNVCSGSSCDCSSGDTCAFGVISGDCNLACNSGASCTGSCTGAATADCRGTTCTLTGGEGSRFTCTGGTCNFTCNGTCTTFGGTVTCLGGTTQGVAGCN